MAEKRLVYRCEVKDELISVHRVSLLQRDESFLKALLHLGIPVGIFCVLEIRFHSVALLLLLTLSCMYFVRRRRAVVEEALVIMPTLGIQLQTTYRSGRTHQTFIPIRKVQHAVINEAVTPTTCYFYLALVLHDEPKLTLVFKHLRPPLTILRPVWKSLVQETRTKQSLVDWLQKQSY